MNKQLTQEEIDTLEKMLTCDDEDVLNLAVQIVHEYGHLSHVVSIAYQRLREELKSTNKSMERVRRLRHIIQEGFGYADFNWEPGSSQE